MSNPIWDGINLPLTIQQLKAVQAGKTVRVDITEEDDGQPLHTPIAIFVRLKKPGTI